ncbi:hypothetical protein DRJ25_00080 [Candidatus Woesearchaeota archaeon]|nr:MAG: hypothetical protein DRJ25_00080 [Candidatus Woesearchaeota archaeon]
MTFSMKELGKVILHVPGLIVLLVIVFIFFSMFFTKPANLAQGEADMIAHRLEDTLKKPGDFTMIPAIGEVESWQYFFLSAEIDGEEGPFIEVEFSTSPTRKNIDSGLTKLDFPVCPKGKPSKKPCVEGTQGIAISLLKETPVFYSESSEGIFHDVKRRHNYETDSNALRFYVAESGRIIMVAP